MREVILCLQVQDQENVLNSCVERHITAEAFAESVNISISFLREIERGNKKPALDNFIKIANELGVSADELLSDSIDSAKPAVLNRITKK